MSQREISKALEQEVAAGFLMCRKRYDHREFLMELRRVGLKFVRDKVDPDDQERFTNAFDELVGFGCLPETLASTLYIFCKSYVVRKLTVPPYGEAVAFPPDEEIKKIQANLQSAVEAIQRIDDYGILEVLARHAKCSDPPDERKQVLDVLRWYIELLPTWWAPRKDIVLSSAPIACSCYVKIATGKFRFSEVGVLLQCLGYRPDLKRQMRSRDIPDESDPCDQSLERNFRNFRNAYPIFCDQLQADLKSDHEKEENRRIEEFDYWVVEKGIPLSVFDQPRPNRFDWKMVFPKSINEQKR